MNMTQNKSKNSLVIKTLCLVIVSTVYSFTSFAKINHYSFPKPKYEIGLTKSISDHARVILKEPLSFSSGSDSITFQNGQITEEVQFFHSPRCYFHLNESSGSSKYLNSGKVLNIGKIEQVVMPSSIHTTFWFVKNEGVSNLLCITNHTGGLTVAELKSTLGNGFKIEVGKQIERAGILRTAGPQSAGFFSRTSADPVTNESMRWILSN